MVRKKKKKSDNVLFIIGGIILALFILSTGRESSLILDDYNIYDSFETDNIHDVCEQPASIVESLSYGTYYTNYPLTCESDMWSLRVDWCTERRRASYTRCKGSDQDVTISGGSLLFNGVTDSRTLFASNGGYITLTAKKDFKGMYIKLLIDGHKIHFYTRSHNNLFHSYAGYIDVDIGGITYRIGDSSLGGLGSNTRDDSATKPYGTQLIEIKPSIIDPDYFEMWVNGQFYAGRTTVDPITVSIIGYGAVEIKELKYKVPFESCSLREGKTLIKETFQGPLNINEDSLSYNPVRYCLDHLVIIIDKEKLGSATTPEPYISLAKGETISISSSQSYSLFYLTSDVIIDCQEEAYNPLTDTCDKLFVIVPSICLDNEIYDIDSCASWLIDYINGYEGQLDEQLQIIADIEYTIQQKIELIAQLNLERDEQFTLIAQLEMTLQEQIEVISTFEMTITEQADYINQLQLNIAEQAVIIESLSLNLAQKAILVNQLTATTEEQASLISQMELSFAEQAGIISELGLTIEQDALLISELTPLTQAQAIIISNMGLTLDEQSELIDAMNLNLEDQVIIIANLRLSESEQQRIIDQLTLTIIEQDELILKLQEYDITEQPPLEEEVKEPTDNTNLIIISVGVVGAFLLLRRRR